MDASSVQQRSQLKISGRARAEAHKEHEAHVRDAGSVETQRLVELPCKLPSGKGTREDSEMTPVSGQVVR